MTDGQFPHSAMKSGSKMNVRLLKGSESVSHEQCVEAMLELSTEAAVTKTNDFVFDCSNTRKAGIPAVDVIE